MRYIYQSELKHYGVKGMKWGVRKEYEPVGKTARKEKPVLSKTKAMQNKGKSVKSKTVKDVEKDKAKAERNKKLCKKILLGVGAVTVAALVTYAVYKRKGYISDSARIQKVFNTATRSFDYPSSAHSYSMKHLYDQSFVDSLTDNERKSIEEYTCEAYENINKNYGGSRWITPSTVKTRAFTMLFPTLLLVF